MIKTVPQIQWITCYGLIEIYIFCTFTSLTIYGNSSKLWKHYYKFTVGAKTLFSSPWTWRSLRVLDVTCGFLKTVISCWINGIKETINLMLRFNQTLNKLLYFSIIECKYLILGISLGFGIYALYYETNTDFWL